MLSTPCTSCSLAKCAASVLLKEVLKRVLVCDLSSPKQGPCCLLPARPTPPSHPAHSEVLLDGLFLPDGVAGGVTEVLPGRDDLFTLLQELCSNTTSTSDHFHQAPCGFLLYVYHSGSHPFMQLSRHQVTWQQLSA